MAKTTSGFNSHRTVHRPLYRFNTLETLFQSKNRNKNRPYEQTTAHSGSHDQSEVSARSCDGNPPDRRDPESETHEPIASHTRQKTRQSRLGTGGDCVGGSDSSETNVPAAERGATLGDTNNKSSK